MNFKTPQFVFSRILETFSGHLGVPSSIQIECIHQRSMYSHLPVCVCMRACVLSMRVHASVLFFMHDTNDIFFTSSTRRRGICRKLSSSLSLTCVWRSGKQSLMFRKTSLFSCEHIEPFIHESFDVPSLLCSQSDVSLSLTFAIFTFTSIHTRRTYNLARLT